MSVLWIAALLAITVPFVDASERNLFRCKRMDLGLVVDATKSIQRKNVPFLRRSLKELIRKFDISEEGTHVSLETFANNSKLHNKFKDKDFHETKSMMKLIQNSISDLTMPTRLDRALFTADQQMFVEKSGDRAGVRSVMVLYTDGKSHPETKNFKPAVDSLKEKGVRIVVVAVGQFSTFDEYQDVLKTIAGNNIIYVDDYKDLMSTTEDIQRLICPPSPCKSPGLDVAFLFDRTRSLGIEAFRLLKGFLLEIVDALDVGYDATHTGIILFAKNATVLNTFDDSDYYSNEALHHLISNVTDTLGPRTFIDRALIAANEELFTVMGGDRPEFPNVLVLMTDGRTNPASRNFSGITPLLKAKKVRIVAVGIGKKIFSRELESITGNKENVHLVQSIDGLPDLFSKILNETCSVDGGFSRWGFWSKCNATCGEGQQTRTRTCSNPSPRGFGLGCFGDDEELRGCNEGPCVSADVERIESDPGLHGLKLPALKKSKFFKRIAAQRTRKE